VNEEMAKTSKNWMYAAYLIIGILVVGSYMGYINFTQNPAAPVTPGQGITNPTNPPNTSGMVSATKDLKIVMANGFSGAALTGTTNAVKIYSADGKTILETCTLSSGSCTTANAYASGTSLVVYYFYSTTEFMFWNVVVPQMSQADAQSLTTNQISLKGFTVCTLTDTETHSNGTALTDGTVMNATTNPTGSITYSTFVVADNTGFIDSFDPVYGVHNQAVIWATVSGGSYTSVSLSGFDGKITKGTTDYYYKVIDPNSISKEKVGNNYVLSGSQSFTFSYTAIGYTGSTTVLQMYLYIYSDPAYLNSFGSYGPYASQLSEQTVTLTA